MEYLFEEFCDDCVLKHCCSHPCDDIVEYYTQNAENPSIKIE